VVLPPPSPPAEVARAPFTREPARDTLAPSSFGVLGGPQLAAAPALTPARGARAPLPTLGELEGATATATLRPPGAVPPPPRALPTPTPNLESGAVESPLTPAAGPVSPSPRSPQAHVTASPLANATVPSEAAFASSRSKPAVEAALESTLDMSGSASKKATQAALVEATRASGGSGKGTVPSTSAVPAPGLFIADEPLERRPQLPSLVAAERQQLTRLRVVVLLLGGLLLIAAGALVVSAYRRADVNAVLAPAPSAKPTAPAPGCAMVAPPSRISSIERAVPISALGQADGRIALAIADTKATAAGWIYDPVAGEPTRKLEAPPGSGDISHVSASDPLVVDRANPDFSFAQTLAPGLALGVGPAGLLRRGDDGATGVIWPLTSGMRVTAPRAASTPAGHVVAFRQGGAQGQIMLGWLRPDGRAEGELTAIEGAPKTLGTPNVSRLGERAQVLFSARGERSEPYRVYAAVAAPGLPAAPAQVLELPAEGGGALAPSLASLPGGRYVAQWTDGNVGQYRVHVRVLDEQLKPASDALLVSGKGANAGQGTIVTTGTTTVSFFIQTTAGHDELWGVALSCH